MAFINAIRDRLRYLRFKSKVLILIFVSVFVPLVTALLLFNNYTSDTARARAGETTRNAFDQTYEVMTGRFDLAYRSIALLMADNNVRDLIQTRPYDHDLLLQRKMIADAGLIFDYVEQSASIAGIRVYVDDNYDIILDNRIYFKVSALYGLPWYEELTAMRYRRTWTGDGDALSCVVRVNDPKNYKRTASLVRLYLSKTEAETTLRQALNYEGSYACLLASAGEVVASSSFGDSPAPALLDGINLSGLSMHESRSLENEGFSVMYRAFKNHPWTLVMIVPQHGMAQTINSSQLRTIFLLAFVSGVFIFAVCLLFSRNIISRIQMVSSGLKDMENGVLKPLEPSAEKDEIGALVDSYNYLTKELGMLISANYLAGVQQKNAELRALQSQINPHFLYNTLELINYYAFSGEPDGVEHIVSLLSKFYKLSLNHGEALYQVWQELELTKVYYAIQNIRFNGNITLVCDVPVSLYHYEMPRIILQPLVENAINHGIMNRADKTGEIRVTAEERGQDIFFTVEDNGAGMAQDKMERMNGGMGDAGNDGGAVRGGSLDVLNVCKSNFGSHYGIRNINERLRTYYGDGYGLLFEAVEGDGTKVIIRLRTRVM